MKYRMTIKYPNGVIKEGKKDHNLWFQKLGLQNINFQNKAVLDIATDEGWWAFNAEMLGAKYVEACDVEKGKLYDWGYHKDINWINSLDKSRKSKSIFLEHHKELNSKVIYKQKSIYDITGKFDYIFCHGLFYHLRHPLLALDKVRAVCNNVFCFETHVDLQTKDTFAVNRFYRTDEYCNTISNWTGATIGCYASWLKDSGFEHIFVTDWGPYKSDRRIFIALTNDQYADTFINIPNLNYLDEEYFDKIYTATKYKL